MPKQSFAEGWVSRVSVGTRRSLPFALGPASSVPVRYRLLIFDFDGTLADTFPAFQAAFREAIPRFGLRRVEPSDFARLRGMGAREVIRFLGLPMWQVPQVGQFVREVMGGRPVRLFDGMEDALRQLAAAGVKLAVVSSNSEENVRRGLGPALAGLFEAFDCGASLFGKAAKFRRVAKRTACKLGEVLAIGDELRDAEAAKSAKMAFGAVAWGFTELTSLEQGASAEVFHAPGDLLRLLA